MCRQYLFKFWIHSTAYIGDAYTAKKAAAGDKLTLKEIDEVSYELRMNDM